MQKVFDEATGQEVEVATQAELREILPRVLPAQWRDLDALAMMPFAKWYGLSNGLRVCVSAMREGDGRRWLHVSMSHVDRLPTWQEVKDVKDVVIGAEKTALQVLPPKSRYVNIHPYALHLWHCLDGDVVPDFSHGGQI